MSEWQPIETAPKDGTMFLGARAGHVWVRVSFWRKTDKRFGWHGAQSMKTEVANQPTHWMHLPEPPRQFEERAARHQQVNTSA